MKIATFSILLLAIISCQGNKDVNPKAFQLLEGKWEQIGHQTIVDGKGKWIADSTNGRIALIIRADGVPLNENGKGFCCSPRNYLLNGKLHPIELKSPIELEGNCATSICRLCETVELQVTETTLLWNACNSYQIKYRKLP